MSTETIAASWSLARSTAREIGGFFFPPHCLLCAGALRMGWFRGGTCETCWEAIAPPDPQRCETCDEALPASDARSCGRCLLDPPPYETLRAATPYRGRSRDALLALKLRGADYLAPHLAGLLIRRLAAPSADEIACVPAARGARPAGDHAAEILARAIARRLGVRFSPRRLEKTRRTERQRLVPLARRAANVRGAFRGRGLPPPRVLLVDDVATSGATARECARALLEAGAERVDVWCFARASRSDADAEPSIRSTPEADPASVSPAGGGR